ncbi:glutathione S-transferase 4 [Aegilops tauschii subsp. strangulata]|uniref:glutathione transferase n=2 Tax=Aegilops tauschii subsp. strangulata TaxID=200361 RepID=A0A452XZS9_AEGTS|nr:glutathione S-transferase 4 [Aegilops tauschii subsp. strangulata]
MAPALKVYGWAVSPFVARPLLCLEEAGVDYELIPMKREAGDHLLPDFLAKNPFGQVPVLEDGDLTLFESRAIARHVLRKYKPELLVGDGSPESAAMVDVWLEVEAHQHHPVAGAISIQCLLVPLLGGTRDQAIVDENVVKLRKVLEVYEARLSASKYLAGESVSLADLSHLPLMHYFMETEYASLVEERPHVKAWWEELKARPAARKVKEFMSPDFGLGNKAEQ